MPEMMAKSRNDKEEFQQVRKLLSNEHQGNQDRTPEAESADILLF